jgi:hypothetical protein
MELMKRGSIAADDDERESIKLVTGQCDSNSGFALNSA